MRSANRGSGLHRPRVFGVSLSSTDSSCSKRLCGSNERDLGERIFTPSNRSAAAVLLLSLALLFSVALPTPAAAAEGAHGLRVERPAPGSVTRAEGLEAWSRIFAVFSHPRCANCHTDSENTPMWATGEGPAKAHGMYINAGASRTGEEFLPCITCHATSTAPNTVPHAPPHAGMPWQLAPAEFLWFGEDTATVCDQVRDPRRNGGRNGDGLIEHILHDKSLTGFITWAFAPGGGREPAPGTLQEHLDDTIRWVAAGMPCPEG